MRRIVMIDFDVKSYIKSVIPAGRYTFRIGHPEIKDVKKNDGSRLLNISLTVVSDYRKGARISDNFNLYHIKENVAEMAREKFAKICDYIDLPDIKHFNEIDGRLIEADISIETYNGDDKNKVDKYYRYIGDKKPEIKSEDIPFDDEIKF